MESWNNHGITKQDEFCYILVRFEFKGCRVYSFLVSKENKC